MLIGGKVAVVCGYGDVGKGCAESLRGQGARVVVTEIDPICALQAAMEGYQVDHARGRARRRPTSSSPTTGNKDIITADHMARMKHQAIVGNIGHFDNEIDMAGLASDAGHRAGQHQAAGRQVDLPRRPRDHRAVRGPAAEPGQRHRAPELRDVATPSPTRRSPRSSCSPRPTSTTTSVYVLPKHLDEKVARLHLDALGVKLTTLTKEQADYIGVPVDGPYKPDHYRY